MRGENERENWLLIHRAAAFDAKVQLQAIAAGESP
jgi:hypothetical protein